MNIKAWVLKGALLVLFFPFCNSMTIAVEVDAKAKAIDELVKAIDDGKGGGILNMNISAGEKLNVAAIAAAPEESLVKAILGKIDSEILSEGGGKVLGKYTSDAAGDLILKAKAIKTLRNAFNTIAKKSDADIANIAVGIKKQAAQLVALLDQIPD